MRFSTRSDQRAGEVVTYAPPETYNALQRAREACSVFGQTSATSGQTSTTRFAAAIEVETTHEPARLRIRGQLSSASRRMGDEGLLFTSEKTRLSRVFYGCNEAFGRPQIAIGLLGAVCGITGERACLHLGRSGDKLCASELNVLAPRKGMGKMLELRSDVPSDNGVLLLQRLPGVLRLQRSVQQLGRFTTATKCSAARAFYDCNEAFGGVQRHSRVFYDCDEVFGRPELLAANTT
jgi:hypothetical protein